MDEHERRALSMGLGPPRDFESGARAIKELEASVERHHRENTVFGKRNLVIAVAAAVFAFVAMVGSVIQVLK